ncbi:MAG: alpha/beta hydrolase [Armatimonadetes bacterium]|nr:alpha/beta hydrolase [Armatimonadota bacterium]
MMVRLEEKKKTASGHEMQTYRWPCANPAARLLIVHGYLEHAGRYDEFAQYLTGQGIEVTAFDHRGHGRSAGPRGFVGRFEDYLDDVGTVLDGLGEGPRFLLGQSMGGLVALAFAAQRKPRLNGLILTNPYLENALKVPGWKIAVANFLGNRLPMMSLPAGLDRKLLSHDPEILKAHEADTMILQNANAHWFVEITAAQQRASEIAALEVPLLLVVGDRDLVAAPEASLALFQRLACADKTLDRRSGWFHEVLNETERATLYEAIAGWISVKGSSPSPGAA